jgi:hypothetical protein
MTKMISNRGVKNNRSAAPFVWVSKWTQVWKGWRTAEWQQCFRQVPERDANFLGVPSVAVSAPR